MNVVLWVALALGLVNVAVWTAVVVAARRYWRQLAPQVAPLLAMFMPPEPTPAEGSPPCWIDDDGSTVHEFPQQTFGAKCGCGEATCD